MKLKPIPSLLVLLLLTPVFIHAQKNKKQQEYYQLSIYNYSTVNQESALENFLQHVLLPAYHKQQIKKVGVFKAINNDTALVKKMIVLIPFHSLEQLEDLNQKIFPDPDFIRAGQAYLDVPYNAPAYDRLETILLKAFALMPQLSVPILNTSKAERVYELRSYESPSEKLFRSKVKMFNEGGEIEIFKRLNFNAVFYGQVIAGSHMPNLMYLTAHENKLAREANWKNFGSDPAWKKLNAMPEYKNNVSHIDISFLRPTEYSDL